MKKETLTKADEAKTSEPVLAGSEVDQPPAPLPPLKASPIPQVEAKVIETVIRIDAAPADEFYTDGIVTMKKGEWKGEQFALCIHEADTYSRTHSCKNSLHFWQGKEEEFDEAFKS